MQPKAVNKINRCAVKYSAIIALMLTGAFVTGCGKATYPADKLQESVVNLCKDEYGITVKAKAAGGTLAVYMPCENLFDANLGLTTEASDLLNNVLLSISRVSLSTDADLQFYVLIVQDPRIPDIQMVVIKSVEDLRRFFYGNISRGEYFKRMLYDVNFTPQAQKEKLIKNLFVNLDIEGVEEALDMYMKKVGINSIDDIGYWGDEFFIKDITMTEFYAKQIESRIKMEFRSEENVGKFRIIEVKSNFETGTDANRFRINAQIQSTEAGKPSDRIKHRNDILESCLRISSDVICGYKFKEFNNIEIIDNTHAAKISVAKEALFQFNKQKLNFSDIPVQSF